MNKSGRLLRREVSFGASLIINTKSTHRAEGGVVCSDHSGVLGHDIILHKLLNFGRLTFGGRGIGNLGGNRGEQQRKGCKDLSELHFEEENDGQRLARVGEVGVVTLDDDR